MTLHKWLRQADIEDDNCPGKTREDSAELRELRRRMAPTGTRERGPAPRGRLPLPGEPTVTRLYPLVSELPADGIPAAVSLRILPLSRAPYYRRRPQQIAVSEIYQAYRANTLYDARYKWCT
ncbi:hypothetical protein PQG76_07120 [Corynebacterium falsenii]|uniref:hypothetical protein n=1 Tax=Corynebacterium falsenii TaxID=108486 RepID=UPI001CCC3FEF|nr:hypothetical protein [Corynebacterium falsenii]MDC7104274.1 hypothetical protein [Corynebacterium falsenii]UBI06815.1 hypothetical protein LA329_00325 [Corynebacterium falsenii]